MLHIFGLGMSLDLQASHLVAWPAMVIVLLVVAVRIKYHCAKIFRHLKR